MIKRQMMNGGNEKNTDKASISMRYVICFFLSIVNYNIEIGQNCGGRT
jgi:hypothetical protein